MKLMYITNRVDIAEVAEESGVNRIFVDLEMKGKTERQKNLDTVISRHNIEDISSIKKCLKKADLLVRTNSIHSGYSEEIEQVISNGADIIMLPYFKTQKEVEYFINCVNGRARTCLLCETPEAVENIDEILSLGGIDEIHIGLNDLHLGYRMKFMFELLTNGIVDKLCYKFRQKHIPFGFGGIARLGQGALPAEYILAEHYRLGSSMVILSRSFINTNNTCDINQIKQIFAQGIKEIRDYEQHLSSLSHVYFNENHRSVIHKVESIAAGVI